MAQFTARKTKSRISAETSYRPASSGISNNVSLRSWKNHLIHVNLNDCFFRRGGGKLDLNCPLVPLLKVIINHNLAYNTTIHLDAKFQFLGICCSRLYPKETITFFFVSGPNWTHFGRCGAIHRQIVRLS